jgi:hypothetical protein
MKDQNYIIEADMFYGDIDVLTESEARDISYKERKKAKDSQYLDHKRRSFPILKCSDIPAAVHAWGRYKGSMSFDQFKARLMRKAKQMGCESSIPASWKKKSTAESVDSLDHKTPLDDR